MSILWCEGRYYICKIIINSCSITQSFLIINMLCSHEYKNIIMQVSTNGVVTFGSEFTNAYYPRPFPLRRTYMYKLIAPFWDNSNVRNGGQVLFRLSDNQTLLNQVGSTINDTLEFDFTPTMIFIATWSGLPEYRSSQNIV